MFEAGSLIFKIISQGQEVFRRETAEADKAVKELGKSTTEAGKSTEDLGKKQETAKEKARRLAQEQTEAAKKARELAQAQQQVGRVLVTVGASILAMTGLAVKSAIEWESAWAGVTKTVDATPEALERIEGGLRGLAQELPATHGEIAAVAEAAGQLGIAADDVVGFTKTMIDLGETTNLTSDEAATAIAQLMNIMQTAPENVDRLGSALVELGNNGASTEKDIIFMAQRIASAGKVIGLQEHEVLAMANALASAGIEVEAGGSAISRIMMDIAKDVSTNSDNLTKWAGVAGMSADQFAKKFKDKPAHAINDFILGLGRMNDAGEDVFTMLDDLGQSDIRTSRALLSMANAGDLLSGSLEMGAKAWEENLALQTEAEKRYATTEAQLGIMRNNLNDAAISLGEVFLPAIAAASKGVADFAGFMALLPEPIQAFIGFGGVAVGVTTMLGGAALIAVPKVVEFRQALKTLAEDLPAVARAGRGLTSFLLGPWGIALAAAAVVIGLLIGKNEEYQNRVEELTGTLDENTGAFTENTRAAVANKLQKDGAFEAAEKMGISAKELTDAVMGEGDAFETVTARMRAYSAEHGFADSIANQFGNGALQTVGDALNRETDALKGAQEAHEKVSEATKTTTTTTKTATEAYKAAAGEVKSFRDELDELIDLINEANDVGMDAVTANTEYQQALTDVDEHLEKIRKGVEGYGRGLSDATQAGRDNREMLYDQAKAARDAAEAQFTLDGNVNGYRQRLEESRQALIDNAIALGGSAEEAGELADQILRIPSESEWKMIVDLRDAQRAVDNFVRQNDGRAITVIVNGQSGRRVQGVDMIAQADGGRVSFFANGGRENHVAQFARAGTYRVWAEPETEGEWYIPAAKSKRARSTMILEQAANEFGYSLVPNGAQSFADGGMSGVAGSRVASPVQLTGDLYLDSGEFIGTVRGVVRSELSDVALEAEGGRTL